MSGSTSGAVSFPTYMEDTHKAWLNNSGSVSPTSGTDLQTILNVAHTDAGNPFFGEAAYDPTDDPSSSIAAGSPLGRNQTKLDSFETEVSGIDEEADWASMLAKAKTELDTNFNDAALNRIDPAQLKAINRFTAGMADINAVNSSAFVIGLALIESEVTKGISQQIEERRGRMLLQAVAEMIQLLLSRVTGRQTVATLQAEISKILMIALQEQRDRDLEIDEADARWDLEVFAYGQNLLSSISGAPMVPRPLSKGQSALAGALGGASAGAAFGPIGMGVGAIVGGALGYNQ